MEILVIDASVAFDLERGGLLEAVFKLRYEFVTPDLLYLKELENDAIGATLCALGLQVVELTSDEVNAAQALARGDARLSRPDCWAAVCAKRDSHRLLCGDATLRSRAEAEAIRCSGLLWILDRLEDSAIATPWELADALSQILKHHRVRLPKGEVEARLARWMALAERREISEPSAQYGAESDTLAYPGTP